MSRRASILALLLCALPALLIAGEIVEEESGQTFPARIEVVLDGEKRTLIATGTALREKFWFDLYAAVAYVDESVELGGDPGQAIVKAEALKQVQLRMLRDVDSERITNGVNKALETCAVVPLEEIADEREAFLGLFGDEKLMEKDDLRMLYRPGVGLEVSVNGDILGTIPGEGFGQSFFAIYLGDPSVNHLGTTMIPSRMR